MDNTEDMSTIDGTFSNNKMWNLKKKILPRAKEALTAKKDINGQVITNPEMIRNLYIQCFQ